MLTPHRWMKYMHSDRPTPAELKQKQRSITPAQDEDDEVVQTAE